MICIFLAVTAVGGCGSSQPPLKAGGTPSVEAEQLCREMADCGGLICTPPGTTHGGAPPPMPELACASDDQCEPGKLCQRDLGPFGVSARCAPPCQQGSCPLNWGCSAQGRCEPLPCNEGRFRCKPFHTCGGAEGNRDIHGCSRLRCDDDGPCGEGACVMGFCYEALGRCEQARP